MHTVQGEIVMALKLNRPNIDESQQPATNAETARFISGATRAPVVGKPKLMNFRLSAHFEDILEAEAIRNRAEQNNRSQSGAGDVQQPE